MLALDKSATAMGEGELPKAGQDNRTTNGFAHGICRMKKTNDNQTKMQRAAQIGVSVPTLRSWQR
jgi:hypothetical protein